MKLFSTLSFEIPSPLIKQRQREIRNIVFPYFSVIWAKLRVMKDLDFAASSCSVFFNSAKIDGNNRKDVKKVIVSPAVIIQPKSITGLILLKTNDVKANIVVKAVYRQGSTIFFTVNSIRFIWSI